MSQQNSLVRPQQAPWWVQPMEGVGAAIQSMQHNLQRFSEGIALPPSSAVSRQASLTLAASSAPAAAAQQQQLQQQQPPTRSPAQHLDISALHSSSTVSLRKQQQSMQPVTKEELGRATWTFLHTLAAQFPEHPTRQQQRDARQLIDSFTRIYPCADCAQHFQELVKRDPPDVGSRQQFSMWMCRTHNAVNRRLGKPVFNCDLVAARWAPLDCDEHNSCDMTVGRKR